MTDLHDSSAGLLGWALLLCTPEQPFTSVDTCDLLDPAIENARALMGELLQAFPEQDHDSHVSMHVTFMKLPVVQSSPQVYGVFISHVMEHISLKARAMAQQELQQMQMQGMPVDQASMDMKISQIQMELTNAMMPNLMPPPQGPDPLVQIRQQELAIKARRELDPFRS